MSSEHNENSENKEEFSSKAGYKKLSSKGTQEYKKLQYNAVKQFGFWLFAGTLGGYVLSKFVNIITWKKKASPQAIRFEKATFLLSIFMLSYHGYKISKFHFVKGKKKLLANPEYVIEEPNDFTI